MYGAVMKIEKDTYWNQRNAKITIHFCLNITYSTGFLKEQLSMQLFVLTDR